MTEPSVTGNTPAKNPIAAHPITSAIIFVLVAGAICCTLIVPIYASTTPKVGDFPFFYFYLLVYVPVAAAALFVSMLLQRRLERGDERNEVE